MNLNNETGAPLSRKLIIILLLSGFFGVLILTLLGFLGVIK